MELSRMLYVSTASHPMSDQDLLNLLEQARVNNQNKKITGMLICVNSNFMQVIEGERKDIENLYNNILNDERNTNNKVVNFEDVDKRKFDKWAMGFVPKNKLEKLNPPEGYVDLTDPNFVMSEYFSDKHFNSLCEHIVNNADKYAE